MDKKKLALDMAALGLYLIVANPAFTGVSLHEWLGLAVLAVLFVHVVVNVEWVADAARAAVRHPTWARTGNLALDAAILVTLVVCAVSGVLISGAVLPAFGYYAPGYYFWDPLHAISAKVLLALLLVHLAAHWRWVARLIRNGRDGDGRDDDMTGKGSESDG